MYLALFFFKQFILNIKKSLISALYFSNVLQKQKFVNLLLKYLDKTKAKSPIRILELIYCSLCLQQNCQILM